MSNPTNPLVIALAVALALPASAVATPPTNRFERLPATAHAKSLLDLNPKAAAKASGDDFTPRDVIVDRDGTEHVRMDRTYKGLPVIGGDLVVHVRNGSLKSISKTLKSNLRPSLAAAISADEAITVAGAAFGTDFTGLPTASKVVYALGTVPVLAYEVRLAGTRKDQTPTDMRYYVDARTGKILKTFDRIMTGQASNVPAVGMGKGLYVGDVPLATTNVGGKAGGYILVDQTRGNGITLDARNRDANSAVDWAINVSSRTNVFGDYTAGNVGTLATDASVAIAQTWDYYKNVHGRNGIRNDGVGARSYINVGFNLANAFYDSTLMAMYYGSGNGTTMGPLISTDVGGHEMSHGVTDQTAHLIYEGEPGGLNESTSDIFGSMVEFHANNAFDTPDYTIGEVFLTRYSSDALRYMYKPSLDRTVRDDGSVRVSPDCYYSGIGNLDVHYSSGVGNHFFYLLAEGAKLPTPMPRVAPNLTVGDLVCNGNTSLTGLGHEAAEKIWYRALTVYMTSNTNYPGARVASINAANDLFGVGSTQANAVAAAWSAVGVN